MTTRQDLGNEGWTVATLKAYTEAVEEGREKLQTERDRRYAEVNVEREKALKIKEEADKVALDLARQIQTYKDEKANNLRTQIESERGNYLTRQEYEAKHEALITALKPIQDWMSSRQGGREEEDKQTRVADAKFLRFAQSMYVLLSGFGIVIALTAAHVI